MCADLLVERDGPVIVLTMHRPERLNALSGTMHEGFTRAWESVRGDRTIRAIVITGSGERAFCSGMDVRAVAERGAHRALSDNVHDQMKLTPLRSDVWLPTVVAVNGVCAGAGLHFIADADVVVASTNASFTDPHVTVGQVAALEPITLLPRIGLGNALRLAVLGRAERLTASEALRISLVDEVVSPEDLVDRAKAIAFAAAQGSPTAIEASKRAIRGALERPMSEALQAGWQMLVAHREHPDAMEGPRAFAERRAPQWL
jgi:E-phenylitaconyl-CoA hydratase